MSVQEQYHPDESILLKEAPPKLKPPSMYQVIVYNDDFTPMDFVVEILRVFFFKSKSKATEIMLRIHGQGSAVCGIYPHSVAETKVNQVRAYARQHEHPLRCEMIPIDN